MKLHFHSGELKDLPPRVEFRQSICETQHKKRKGEFVTKAASKELDKYLRAVRGKKLR